MSDDFGGKFRFWSLLFLYLFFSNTHVYVCEGYTYTHTENTWLNIRPLLETTYRHKTKVRVHPPYIALYLRDVTPDIMDD